MGIWVVTEPDWHYTEGAYYTTLDKFGVIVMPAVIPMPIERWLIAHELGHHCNPVYTDPTWLAEAKADRWAVRTLLDLYDVDEVKWPSRRTVRDALAEQLVQPEDSGEAA